MAETKTEEGCTSTAHIERLIVHPVGRWHSDHSKFALLLDLLEQQVDAMHKGGSPNYELMQSIVHYLRHNPDRFHHPREDVAFARMVERDPGFQLQVARRLQEHVVIAAAGEKLLTCLKEIMTGAVTDTAALEAEAATYLVYYRHHLEAEEREVIPRAMDLLTLADWEAVAAIPSEPDPLFGADVGALYFELRKRIENQARQAE
jgi:hemerythrin-like domain-containing protein